MFYYILKLGNFLSIKLTLKNQKENKTQWKNYAVYIKDNWQNNIKKLLKIFNLIHNEKINREKEDI